MTEKLEIDIIELPKIEAKQEIAKKLKDEGISIGKIEQITGLTEEEIKQCLFLSPVVNMKVIIDNMMLWSNTTEEELEEKQEIKTDFGQTLYWDYYKYVKDNPIINWNKKTYILYGNKDNMQNEDIIKNFSNKFNCDLTILENGEHYFHTEEQLKFYKKWLEKL